MITWPYMSMYTVYKSSLKQQAAFITSYHKTMVYFKASNTHKTQEMSQELLKKLFRLLFLLIIISSNSVPPPKNKLHKAPEKWSTQKERIFLHPMSGATLVWWPCIRITKVHTPSCLGREEAIRRKGQAGDLAHGGLYRGKDFRIFESLKYTIATQLVTCGHKPCQLISHPAHCFKYGLTSTLFKSPPRANQCRRYGTPSCDYCWTLRISIGP